MSLCFSAQSKATTAGGAGGGAGGAAAAPPSSAVVAAVAAVAAAAGGGGGGAAAAGAASAAQLRLPSPQHLLLPSLPPLLWVSLRGIQWTSCELLPCSGSGSKAWPSRLLLGVAVAAVAVSMPPLMSLFLLELYSLYLICRTPLVAGLLGAASSDPMLVDAA